MTTTLLITAIVGFLAAAVLVKSAGIVVDRSLSIAKHYSIPDLLIGMTVISIGTSLPEITSGIVASISIVTGGLDPTIGASTVIGGNIGSSTVQITLLLGIAVIGFKHLDINRGILSGSYVPMLGAAALLLGLAWDGMLSRGDGVLLVSTFIVYTYISYSRRPATSVKIGGESSDVPRDVFIGLVGLVIVIGSSMIILRIVEDLVTVMGLGGSLVGMMTLGLASSLPELSTVVQAIKRDNPALSVGTLIGSNIVNPLLGLGLATAITTYQVPNVVVLWDLPFKLVIFTALLLHLIVVTDGRMRLREGVFLIAAFFVFFAVRMLFFAGQ